MRAHESVELSYFSSSATAPSRRKVDPYQVVLREGLWYLDGWCHSAGGLRRFQANRVQGVRPLGEHFEPRDELAAELARPGAYLGGPEAVEARIVFPASSGLAVEQVASGPTRPAGEGLLAATVLVSDEGWFGRLLLRLGPGTPSSRRRRSVTPGERLRGGRSGATRRSRLADRSDRPAGRSPLPAGVLRGLREGVSSEPVIGVRALDR